MAGRDASVEIARLALDGLYAALRQDGAPPLYYLLLKAWIALFGTGTIAVRRLTVLRVSCIAGNVSRSRRRVARPL